MNIDSLRPFLSRVIAALVSTLATWLLVHYGIDLDDATRHQLVDAIVGIIIPTFTVAYALAHKTLDKKLNPADSASKHLAVEGKAESTAIKTAEREDRLPPPEPPVSIV